MDGTGNTTDDGVGKITGRREMSRNTINYRIQYGDKEKQKNYD